MENSKIKEAARAQTRGNIITLFLNMLLWGLMLSALLVVPIVFLQAQIANIYLAIAAISSLVLIIMLLIGGIMEFSMAANQNRMFNRESATIAAGFSGFKRPGSSIGTYFMKNLYLFLWALIPIAGLVIVFIKVYSYACAIYIVQEDNEETPVSAITKSKQMMDGRKLQMFRLDLYYGLVWYLLGIFTLGVAWVWGIPRHMQARYNLYKSASTNRERQVTGVKEEVAAPTKYY